MSSDPLFKEGCARFTMVRFKPFQQCGRYRRFSNLKTDSYDLLSCFSLFQRETIFIETNFMKKNNEDLCPLILILNLYQNLQSCRIDSLSLILDAISAVLSMHDFNVVKQFTISDLLQIKYIKKKSSFCIIIFHVKRGVEETIAKNSHMVSNFFPDSGRRERVASHSGLLSGES